MKRCPQCEFIYEDDQSLCDMDGILLVFDSQQLPKPPTSSPVSAKSNGRNRIIPAVAALVLATVLFLVYYVSTHQQPTARSAYVPAAVGATQPPSSSEPSSDSKVIVTGTDAGPTEKSAVVPSPAPEVTESSVNKAKATTATPTGAAKESKEKAKSKSAQKAQSTTRPQQDDSKIGSLIKKTGRLLKKPFKF